ncbi:YsnF/AvaK domain-containing protein [Rubrivirga sp.]|uniref:YsnF/AvaK domain-containing protein n=1 Tax=Rubrivirga sp. TaxID=1885344 RepID=UPI003B52BAFC
MTEHAVILDRAGQPGAVEDETGGRVRVRLPSGAVADLPESLVRRDGASLTADVVFADLDTDGPAVLVEAEEHVDVRTRTRETGRVRARVVTETRDEPIHASGWRETVDVERVPVGRVVTAPEGVRDEDGVVVIPVYEEVLVVERRLVLREEVRLTTRREPVPGPASVPLRRQHVEVDRLPPVDADGDAV